ncbi:MAG: PBP1A family penicillin-binding protein [Candidatus Kapabacteria bacterium]|nr:PBP1A family penicillin-binding protein [Candidatus Kapabacteria bacterium]
MTPLKYLGLLFGLFFLTSAALGLYIYDSVTDGLPSVDQLENPKQNLATQIFSSDGELLDHFFIQRRVQLNFDSIPKDFIKALIATEDRKFYKHWGIDSYRIVGAFLKNISSMKVKEGASTLTMQLARNLFLNQENTLRRKLREAFTAIQIEANFTKDEILEMYCNTVAFGKGAFGIQVAAQIYFDKAPQDLTLSECAFLVGLLKAPEHYNGIINKDKATIRRNLVLQMMYEQKLIDADKFSMALDEQIELKTGKFSKSQNLLAPHFVEMVRQSISKESRLKSYNIYRDGLVIYTTLNSRIQKYANEAVEEHLNEFQQLFKKSWSWANNQTILNDIIAKAIKNHPDWKKANEEQRKALDRTLRHDSQFIDSIKNAATTIQAGVVVMNPFNGAIVAMVGASPKFIADRNDSKYSLNHTTQINRQPGSSFKPFVYALALENGLTPSSMVECGPFSYRNPETGEVWSPRGSGDCASGERVPLAEALRRSINTVAARLVTSITSPSKVVDLAHRLGIQSRLMSVPAIALGAGGEVTPLEMVSAYGSFANNGFHYEPFFLTRIDDRLGATVMENNKTAVSRDVLKKETVVQLTKMLQGVVDAGTGRKVREYFTGVDAAGKTGTTNESADAWFIGYTPQLIAGVWVGFDDHRITFDCIGTDGYAAKAAAPIWGRLMKKIYNDDLLLFKQTKFDFNISDSIQNVDSLTAAQIYNQLLLLSFQVDINPIFSLKLEDKTQSNDSNIPDHRTILKEDLYAVNNEHKEHSLIISNSLIEI